MLDCVWSASWGFSNLLIMSLSVWRPRHHGGCSSSPLRKSVAYFVLFFIFSLTLALCLCWPFPTVTVCVSPPSKPLHPFFPFLLPYLLIPPLLFSSASDPPLWYLFSSEIRICQSPRVSPGLCVKEGNLRVWVYFFPRREIPPWTVEWHKSLGFNLHHWLFLVF